MPEWRKEKFEKVVKNRRLIQPFGNFFGIVSEDSESFECPKCGCTEWVFLGVEHIEREKSEQERKTLFEWTEADPSPTAR